MEWQLKFWEWWTIWLESGKWDDRGRGDGFVMSRHGDTGPYSKENVFIQWARRNNSERRDKTSGLPMGVVKVKNGFAAQAMKNGKLRRYGQYQTPEVAELAYLIAINT